MSILIVTVLFGIIFGFFATQNTDGITVRFANYIFSGIPLYLVVLGSLLMGLLISAVINLVDSMGAYFALKSRESKIREGYRTVEDLKGRVHDLEMENARLKGEDRESSKIEVDRGEERPRNWFERIRHNLSI